MKKCIYVISFLVVMLLSCESEDLTISKDDINLKLWETDTVLISSQSSNISVEVTEMKVIKALVENNVVIIQPISAGKSEIIINEGDQTKSISVNIESCRCRIIENGYTIGCDDNKILQRIKEDLENTEIFTDKYDVKLYNTLYLGGNSMWAYGSNPKNEYCKVTLKEAGTYHIDNATLELTYSNSINKYELILSQEQYENMPVFYLRKDDTDFYRSKYPTSEIKKVYRMYKLCEFKCDKH